MTSSLIIARHLHIWRAYDYNDIFDRRGIRLGWWKKLVQTKDEIGEIDYVIDHLKY